MKQVATIRRSTLVCTTVVLALAACGAPPDGPRGPDERARSVQPSPSCVSPGADPTPGAKVMRSRGDGWRYDQQLPAGYDRRRPGPLVIVLGATPPASGAVDAVGSDAVVLGVAEPHRSVGWRAVDRDERFVRDLVLRAEESVCFDRGDVRLAGTGTAADVARHVADRIDDERVRYVEIVSP